jgi:hypothetical protein
LEHLWRVTLQLELELPGQDVARQIAAEGFEIRLLAGKKLLIQHDEPDVWPGRQHERIAPSSVGHRAHLPPAENPT